MTDAAIEQPEPVIPSPSTGMRWFMRVLALTALGVSLFLLIQSFKGGAIPGCGTDSGFDCESVLNSKWSKWFNLPVSGLALVVYAATLVALASVGPRARRKAKATVWRVLTACGILMIGAAVWFIALQAMALHAFCNWCMVAHACGLVLGITIWFAAPLRAWTPRLRISGSVIAGIVGLGVMIAGQLLQEEPQQYVTSIWASPVPDQDLGAGEDREITLLGGRIRNLRVHDYPLVGSLTAEHIAVYIFDYTCPHCYEQHKNLDAARKRYGDSLAIIPMVMPLDSDCNPEVTETKERHQSACELAKLSLAVFTADRTKFETFHEWMFEGEEPRGEDESARKAVELVGEAALDEAMKSPWIGQEIMKHITFYNVVSRMIDHRAIPMIVVRAMIVAGQPGSPEGLFKALETKEAGVTAPPGAPPLPEAQPPAKDEDASAEPAE